MAILSPMALQCCIKALADLGFKAPNDDAVRAMVEQSTAVGEDFVIDMNECYGDLEKPTGVLDTMDREDLWDIFSQKFLSRSWPMNGEHADMNKFFAELEVAAKAEGWVITV